MEMIKNGLTNVLNLPIIDHREIMNLKDYKRSSQEILGMTHNIKVSKNLRKFIFKMNTPEKERNNKMSAISSIVDIPVPVTYLVNELDNKVINVGKDTNEKLVFEKLQYRVIERYVIRTELIGNSIVGLEMSENCTAEKSKYKVVVIKLTRTEIILKTILIRATRITDVFDNR